jgi:osmotically-inducible protein OsmY
MAPLSNRDGMSAQEGHMEQAWNFSRKMPNWLIGACLGLAVYGFGGLASRTSAQNLAAPAEHPLPIIEATTTQAAEPVADEEIRGRVETALHSDLYFYDAHVTVSMEKGDVLLGGFVSSDWDLLDAMRIARKAAGNRRVVDNLSIELGGRK